MIVFLCLFVAISGVVGPRVISGGILFRDGFALYGGIGKAMIFGLVAFVLLARHQKATVALRPWRPMLLAPALGAMAFLGIALHSIDQLLNGHREAQHLAGAHGGLLAGLLFLLIACVGLQNLQRLWDGYRRQFILSGILAVAFYLFLLVVYALWQPLATIVMHSVSGLLHLSGLSVTIIPPNTLILDKFGITIAQYCSGIESVALFTSLYAIVGLLDWSRLNRRRYFVLLPFALLLLGLCNILRVYGLILAGYYINPDIAFSMFHTYAGMVFFIIYSAVFWSLAYSYLLKTSGAKHANPPSN